MPIKNYINRPTKTGTYVLKKIVQIDQVRESSYGNMLWLSPRTIMELSMDIKETMPHIKLNKYEVDIAQPPVREFLDSLILSQYATLYKSAQISYYGVDCSLLQDSKNNI